MAKSTFLKAEWRKLVMANYSISPEILRPYLPFKTELDTWNDIHYVSLVGFQFVDTTVLRCKIPFHVNFEEVNLRFYVRYKEGNDWKRGVVFIKEIVPRAAITFVANTLYNENYETLPMKHSWLNSTNSLSVEYQWKKNSGWNSIRVQSEDQAKTIADGSEEEFITEHFWGYTKINSGKTLEYGVEHPRWQIYPVKEHKINVDFASVYGTPFGFLKDEKPLSVFLAEGSEILVKAGTVIR